MPKQMVKNLVKWFERSSRVLPWRDDPSPYRVWISEIMLQQTQVITVVPYFERFIEAFGSVEILASASLEEVYAQWAGLGYYSRAKNLHKSAQMIVARGGFAKSYGRGHGESKAEWLELPGVGPYTAGAICSIALGLPEPILDGNVERVMARLFLLSRPELGEAPYKTVLWSHALEWVTEAAQAGLSVSSLNQGLMELGAVVCTPRSPRCGECPLKKGCTAFAAERVGEFPQKKRRAQNIKVTEVRACQIRRQGVQDWVLLERAGEGQWRAGLWDLPQGSLPAKAQSRPHFEVMTKHIVTNHAIERTTQIFIKRGLKEPAGPAIKKSEVTESRWLRLPQVLESRELALGSAAKKSLSAVWKKIQTERA